MAPNNISDNIVLMQPKSNITISDFFAGTNVFITGSTGFMGKVLVEKLLWACEDIGTLYLLVRPKKGVTENKRIQDFLQLPVYDRIREKNPDILKKIKLIPGDISTPNLGISDNDRKLLEDSVSVVFHVAASVRFDDPLKKAILINIRGTKYVMDVVKKMKNLKVMLYVSTTYCNSDKTRVEEKVYFSDVNWRTIIKMAETFDDEMISILTAKILDKHPNTYTFTKYLAENLIYEYSKQLPCAIFRPSIVTLTLSEPVPGWIDNINGPMGLIVGIITGVLHVLYGNENLVNDYIPCDYAINGLIITTWYKGISDTKDCLVINAANGGKQEISPHVLWKEGLSIVNQLPPSRMLWYPIYIMTCNTYLYYFMLIFTHIIPGMLLDVILYLLKQKFRLMNIYRKVFVANRALAYFITHEIKFETKNYDSLINFLTSDDQKTYKYDMTALNRIKAYGLAIIGVKKYILKDNLSDECVAAARNQFKWLHRIHRTFMFVLFLVVSITAFYVMKMLLMYAMK